jgi:putative toxin-antitoxin system antitoxin component (TIGR02293 family)
MATLHTNTTTEVASLLGGKKILKREVTESHDLREALREGLPFQAFESFVKTIGIPPATITKALGIAPRTLARRKERHSFSPEESDRLYRLARVTLMAIQVLGTQEKAKQWLERPNRALGGETPLHLLDTDIGARQVEAVLGRIDYGIFS